MGKTIILIFLRPHIFFFKLIILKILRLYSSEKACGCNNQLRDTTLKLHEICEVPVVHIQFKQLIEYSWQCVIYIYIYILQQMNKICQNVHYHTLLIIMCFKIDFRPEPLNLILSSTLSVRFMPLKKKKRSLLCAMTHKLTCTFNITE